MSFNNYYHKLLFRPNMLSIFINPFYLIRTGLYREVRALAPELKGTLMDFGSGRKPYKNVFVNISAYIGIDIQNEGHSHETEDVDVYYDGYHLPFADQHFDSVFSSEVFEHVFNLHEILLEIRRVMKPGAPLLLTVPFAWDEHEMPNDFRRYTSFGIKDVLEKHGFEIVTTRINGDFVRVVQQLRILYLHHILYTQNKYFNLLINCIFIAPLTLWGLFWSSILPKQKTLYFNTIVLARKR